MSLKLQIGIISSELICNGPWKPRRKHASLIWNNLIYIFGGFDGGENITINYYSYYLYYCYSYSYSFSSYYY